MRRKDEEALKMAFLVLLLILALVAIIWSHKVRYDDCMETKHDEFLCEIYARGGR